MSRTEVKLDQSNGAGGEPLVDLATVSRILRRQWRTVVLITALFLAAAVAYSVLTPKTWRATTRVLLDPRDKQLVGNDVARPQQSIELGWADTRLELVKSYDNLVQVVKKENLVDDPEVMGSDTSEGEDRVTLAVRAFSDMVLVERPKEINLLDVSVTTRSPEKSAQLSQAVAQAFVEGLSRVKVDQIEQANALLSRQVDAMRTKMLEAEARVEEYKRNNGITVTRGNLVDEETLRQTNENLVIARQKAQEAKERWERLRKAVEGGDARVHSQIDGVASAVLGRLKIEAALAERRKAESEQKYGPLHPEVRAAAAEIERVQASIRDELKSLVATAELDHQIARANEENLRKSLDRAQARLTETSRAVVALQELENEAQARRELYKSFVSRMEETNLQKSTQVSDASIVSPAQIPIRPFSPRRGLALALALIAGLGTGLSVALYRGRDQVAELLHRHASEPTAPPAAVPPPVAPLAAEPVPAPAPPVAPLAAELSEPLPDVEVEAEEGARETPAPVEDAANDDGGEDDDEAAPPLPVRPPTRVDLTLLPDRLARLAATAPSGPGSGNGVVAMVESADGAIDRDGLAMLRRLGDELGRTDETRVRAVFADAVPVLTTAALTLGIARAEADAGDRIVLVDLAAAPSPLAGLFEAATPVPVETPAVDATAPPAPPAAPVAPAAFDLRTDPSGIALARPSDGWLAAESADRIAGLADFLDEVLESHDEVLIHLGSAPAAALLFDVGEEADQVVLIVEEAEIGGSRLEGELRVLGELLPYFDGLVVLKAAERPRARRDGRLRRRV